MWLSSLGLGHWLTSVGDYEACARCAAHRCRFSHVYAQDVHGLLQDAGVCWRRLELRLEHQCHWRQYHGSKSRNIGKGATEAGRVLSGLGEHRGLTHLYLGPHLERQIANLWTQLHEDAGRTAVFAEEMDNLRPWLDSSSGAWYVAFRKHEEHREP